MTFIFTHNGKVITNPPDKTYSSDPTCISPVLSNIESISFGKRTGMVYYLVSVNVGCKDQLVQLKAQYDADKQETLSLGK